jgi:hypothetical protein
MAMPHFISQYVSKMNHPLSGRKGIAGGSGAATLGSQVQVAAKYIF